MVFCTIHKNETRNLFDYGPINLQVTVVQQIIKDLSSYHFLAFTKNDDAKFFQIPR